jgi:succinate dehydrogenase/fumarate reductase iron-sulfur protein
MPSILVEIVRKEPGRGGRVKRATVSVTADETVLAVLERLRAESPDGLAFRAACRHGMCGECGVSVNGEGVLACATRAAAAAGRAKRLRIGPLRGMPVLRDLIVDRSAFFSAYAAARPWLEPKADEPERENLVPPSNLLAQRRAEECVMCGVCHADCPVVGAGGAFVGPAALLKAFARVVDVRDAARAERLAWAAREGGVYRCHSAFACLDGCPKGLDPADAIFALRLEIDREEE